MLSNETNMTDSSAPASLSAPRSTLEYKLRLTSSTPNRAGCRNLSQRSNHLGGRLRRGKGWREMKRTRQWYFGCTTAWTPTYTTRQALDRPDVPAPTSGYNVATAFPVLPASATREIVNIPEGWIDDDIVETSTTLDEQEVSSDVSSASSAQTSEMWRVLEQEQEEAFHASLRQLTACNALSELRRETLAEHASSEGELVSPY
ncbi:uncharacterized protein C8Q71DRAFT_551196 [Rhodofomes roseus]|uniref:Uncharacterized protein n=1 Tax=Rhodofomes roseus TaxID=34475 RepID=A0ABQ8KHX3_9APHY|nr:uncharacterized protein C8Q71DRAFT_551196 [Rhodofomes roseus]KAH9837587.1 hypothetical protein C8Q71DRAFT_551196 [Rhodofomes roseus]